MLTAEDLRALEAIVETAVAKALRPLLDRRADDDEPFGPEMRASIEEARAEIAAGEGLTTEELCARFGIPR